MTITYSYLLAFCFMLGNGECTDRQEGTHRTKEACEEIIATMQDLRPPASELRILENCVELKILTPKEK